MQQRKLVVSGRIQIRIQYKQVAIKVARKYPRKKGEIFEPGETSCSPRKLSTINSRQIETVPDTWRLVAISKCNATYMHFLLHLCDVIIFNINNSSIKNIIHPSYRAKSFLTMH